MQKVSFGKTGYKASILGFGVMRLPAKDGKVDFEESTRILRLGLAKGINFLDSHHFYHNGQSEEAIGKAIKGFNRDDLIIQTKIGMYNDYSEGECRRLLEEALKKLGTDYIDFYLSHSLKWESYVKYNKLFIKFTRKAMNEGLIRHTGFSAHDTPQNIIKLIDTGLFSAILLQYNYLNKTNEEALARAHEKGMGVSVMGPVGGGRLVSDWESRKKMYKDKFSSPAELALKFVFSNKNIHTALSGMSSAGQVEENTLIAGAGGTLTEDERKKIEAEFERKKKLLELYCTGCGYCMPCKSGVNIPAVFEILNLDRVYGFRDLARMRYEKLKAEERASSCASCGECEGKCPQNILIRKKLQEAAGIFEG